MADLQEVLNAARERVRELEVALDTARHAEYAAECAVSNERLRLVGS